MLSSYTRWGFTAFFASHLFLTLLLDAQAIPFVAENSPEFLIALMKYHVETNHDYLMVSPAAPWFGALVWMEIFFQVPFFAFATVAFVKKWNTVRIPCIIYGSSAATSVVPIIGDVLASDKLTDPQRYKLIGIYMPWIILPVILMLIMAADPTPFGIGARPMASKKRF